MARYGLRELVHARIDAAQHARSRREVKEHHAARYAALAAAFGLDARHRHGDAPELEALLDATIRTWQAARSPFGDVRESPLGVVGLYRRFDPALAPQLDAVRDTLESLMIEIAATAWDVPVDSMVSTEDLLAVGFDPDRPAPDA